jgi:Zn-dependent alcohol dehydrogenase
VRRGGTAVAVGIPPFGSVVTINAGELVYQEKTLKGSYYGTGRPHADMPRLLDLYLAGRLPLDRLVSRSYPLEEVNQAYDALLAGEVARSVLLPNG